MACAPELPRVRDDARERERENGRGKREKGEKADLIRSSPNRVLSSLTRWTRGRVGIRRGRAGFVAKRVRIGFSYL